MRLDVDWDRCEGNGLCERVAPAMFALDEYGEMRLLREADPVPPELETSVSEAVHACPMTTLRVRP